jgi:hypothetical protein
MLKPKKIITTFLILLAIGLFLFIVLPLYLKALQYKQEKADYTKHSTPLEAEVVSDICTKLAISSQDKRCQQGAVVYAHEFFEDIKQYFRDLPDERSTKEEVDLVIGSYQLECEPLIRESSGKEYFSCIYDLRGDWYARISIFYTKEGEIDYIMTSLGGS